MKALVLESYHRLVYREVADPEIRDDEVLVKIRAAGVCGSDVHGMDGSSGRRIPPLIMGHEASGTILETGKNVSGWKAGDRVTFDSTIYRLDDWYTRRGWYNLSEDRMIFGVSTPEFRRDGAYAEYLAVPQHILYSVPEEVTYSHAALVEPAAVALHALRLAPPAINERVVVVGTGMIGLFVVQLLSLAGCSRIIAVDTDPEKLKMAGECGATDLLNANREDLIQAIEHITDGRGADLAIEAVGNREALFTAVHSLRKGGTATLIGNLLPVTDFPLQSVVTRQIRLQGSCAICGEYPDVLALMNEKKIKPEAILSAEAPLSDGASWFDRLYRKEKGLIKVVLIP